MPLDREAVREVVRQRGPADRVGARDAEEVAVGRELDVGQDARLPGLDVGVRAGRVAGGRDREDAVIGGEADDMDARCRVRDAVDREGPGREAILGPDIPEPEVLVRLLDERALEADVPRGQRRLFGRLVGLGLGLAVGERVSGGILREGRHPRDSRGQEDSESDPDEPTPPFWQRHRSPTPDDIRTPSAAIISSAPRRHKGGVPFVPGLPDRDSGVRAGAGLTTPEMEPPMRPRAISRPPIRTDRRAKVVIEDDEVGAHARVKPPHVGPTEHGRGVRRDRCERDRHRDTGRDGDPDRLEQRGGAATDASVTIQERGRRVVR